ncbi:MAG: lytic transglycosylase domain-containing protein [Gemmatimonadaceae bacterium]
MRKAEKLISIGITAVASLATISFVGAGISSHSPVTTSVSKKTADLRLPAAVVVAKQPSLDEILDLVLGDRTFPDSRLVSIKEEDRIRAMLRSRTSDANRADRIATALVREGKRSGIGATLLVGVLLTENPDLEPRATSSAGARGLMQVMPFHAGHWGCPSSDLFDIESNICHGVRILADNLRHSRTLPAALLRYNGCVHGTNTPDCRRYARVVYRYARSEAVGPGGKVTASTPFRSLSAE